jgi:radical SAM protein with 4Fe4S-binding SPASM domain
MVTAGRTVRLARRLREALRRDWAGLRASLRLRTALRPGLYTYRVRPRGGSRRLHLRVDPRGSGVLLVDVADAIHLNPAAVFLAKAALDGLTARQAATLARRRFRDVDPARLDGQIQPIYALVHHLSTTTDGCPTCGLTDVARAPLFSTPVHAPYKADLALSYACNNACRHCYNPADRKAMRSLSPAGWRRVLRKLAGLGVPHVIFTGGEPTLFDGLPKLVRYGAGLGLLTGLNTNGRRLGERAFADALARAGLDHVQITLHSHRAEVHNAVSRAAAFDQTIRGVRNSLAAGLHTITNTTLTRLNAPHAVELVELVHSLGVRTFALNAMIYSGAGRTSPDALCEDELAPVLVAVRDRAAELAMRFLWYTPTAYCRLSPVELELGPRRCNAAEYSICIEPSGDVLPCQSYYTPAGNLLRDSWEQIWHSRLFCSFRSRVAEPRACGLPESCWDCPDLPLCAGGCRIEREANARPAALSCPASSQPRAYVEEGTARPLTIQRASKPVLRPIFCNAKGN